MCLIVLSSKKDDAVIVANEDRNWSFIDIKCTKQPIHSRNLLQVDFLEREA